MIRHGCSGLFLVLCLAMLPLRAPWALSIDQINIDPAGSLDFTLSNDDGIAYDGIIIETPFTSADQFQLGGNLPGGWTQSFDLAGGLVRSIYLAVPGPAMGAGQSLSFGASFDTLQIPDINDFLASNAGTFNVTAFSGAGDFTRSYSLGLATVPLPMSWVLLISGLGVLMLLAGKRPRT